MPLYAIIMNSLIFGLSQFMHSLERVRANADYYCLMMFILALCCYSFACI
jgi:ATP-binding cassette subfamily B (MDR/TAP) protein 1